MSEQVTAPRGALYWVGWAMTGLVSAKLGTALSIPNASPIASMDVRSLRIDSSSWILVVHAYYPCLDDVLQPRVEIVPQPIAEDVDR